MDKLFEKITLGNVEIKNRSVMPAMGTNMSDGGKVNKAIINHYKERAKGGVGLIIVEVTCVDTPLGLNTPDMLRIDDDNLISGHKRLVDEIHKHGSKTFLQLSHTGRGAKPDVIGAQPVGPSDITMPYSFMMGLGGVKPKKLTIDEIKEIEDKYAEAALRAKKAGYDGVEIHCCGYYLCQQFLSSQANNRNDEYGGNKKNRARFVLNIIEKVKKLCGMDYPIIIKLSMLELGQYGGISIFDGLYYAHVFSKAGISAIEILAGSWNEKAGKRDKPETGQGKGLTIPLAIIMRLARATKGGRVNFLFGKKAVDVALIAGGRTFDPKTIKRALKSADMVFIGRGVLADPNLINLIKDNKFHLARPCIGCNHCVNEQLQFRHHISCAGSAAMGYDDNDYSIVPATKSKSVVVVGAGPAGSEAARIAAMRGHKVTIYDKETTIGGQINLAIIPPYKQNIDPLINYYKNQLQEHRVDLKLGVEVTPELLKEINPDTIVFATGTKPSNIKIKGYDKPIVKCFKDILKNSIKASKIVIIGGGTIGCELAEVLAKDKKKVTIVEMMDTLASKMAKTAQTVLMGHLEHLGVDTMINSKVKEIKDQSVIVIDEKGEEKEISAEAVIMCIGDRPNDDLYIKTKDQFSEVYNIGDSEKVGDIKSAVRSGYVVGNSI